MRKISVFFFFLISVSLYGQTVITGEVTDSLSNKLSNAIVKVLTLDDETIAAYAISDKIGKYTLSTKIDSGLIVAQSLGYEIQSFLITPTRDTIVQNFNLKDAIAKYNNIYTKI